MSTFADTSFLFAIYLPRAVSEQAMAKVESLQDAPLISSLVRFEFQQAVWFKVWLRAQGQPLGMSETAAQSALAAFELDVEQAVWVVAAQELESVVTRAEKLALDHTLHESKSRACENELRQRARQQDRGKKCRAPASISVLPLATGGV